jgi:hypothetical protein
VLTALGGLTWEADKLKYVFGDQEPMKHPLSKRLVSLSEDIFHNGPPRPVEEMEELEQKVGERFPDDYRAVLLEVGPCAVGGPNISLVIDLIEDVLLSLTNAFQNERMPGIVMIGNDGGDYGYYYDPSGHMGRGKFALYFVEMGTLTFDKSRFVAKDLSEAIEKVLAGKNFRDLPTIGN